MEVINGCCNYCNYVKNDDTYCNLGLLICPSYINCHKIECQPCLYFEEKRNERILKNE